MSLNHFLNNRLNIFITSVTTNHLKLFKVQNLNNWIKILSSADTNVPRVQGQMGIISSSEVRYAVHLKANQQHML